MEPRNYEADAAAAPPAAPAAPSNGFPTAADPGLGINPTQPGPFWFYGLGEEIRSVIAAAGLAPSDADLTQLLQAIQGGAGLAKSFATNGYFTLPGGLILQWGQFILNTTASSTAAFQSVTFPITFPNALLTALPTNGYGTGDTTYEYNAWLNQRGVSGITIGIDTTRGGTTSHSVYWFAIGY